MGRRPAFMVVIGSGGSKGGAGSHCQKQGNLI